MCGMLRFTPQQVYSMSLAEAFIAIDGFIEMENAKAGVKSDEGTGPPSLDEVHELMRLYPDT